MQLRAILVTWWCILVICALHSAQSAQILGLFSHPGKSHFDFFRPLFLGLADAGHNLTVISYFPNKKPVPNYHDIELSGMPIFADIVDLKAFENSNEIIPFKMLTYFMLHEWGMTACEFAFNSDAIKNLLKTPFNFDAIILEQFNNDCMMAIAYMLKAPVIAVSSCALMPWHYHRMGSTFDASYMPMNFLPYTDEMNFVARINNFVHFHAVKFLHDFYTQRLTDQLIQKYFGSAIPPVKDLIRNTSLMLINQHFSLTGAYPYAPNVIEIGGLHIASEEAPLERHLKTLLDNSINGVIYISWGSMVRPDTLPSNKRDALMNAISQLPEYTFLMRWSNETIPKKPKNLHTMAWMPQRDILCHKNVKAFMNHGGLLGTSEAAYCGVPMLVTPFYGDQFLNSATIEKRKLGVIVKYADFNEQQILMGLRTILKSSFSKNVKLLSEAYRSRPMQPLNLSIFWVEHVIQTRGAPLAQSASKELSWFIRNSFDIYLFVCIFLLALFSVIRIIFKLSNLFILKLCIKKQKLKLQ